MTKFHYLTLAYSLFWLVMGFYLFGLGRRLKRLSHTLSDIKRRMGSDAESVLPDSE